MHRRQEGRDETIVDPDLPIVDAHHHLFIRPTMRYMPEEYLADVLPGHNVVASVYVEGGAFFRPTGPEALKPLGEIEFANGVGAMAAAGAYEGVRICSAIVGYADFRLGSAVGELFDRAIATAPDRFRGIRQITMDHPSETPWQYFMSGRPPAGVLHHPNFRTGFSELARRDLVFDAAVFHNQLGDVAMLADAFPNTQFVLNNLGTAMNLDSKAEDRSAGFATWKAALLDIAKRANFACKISGLGMPFWGFGLHERSGPIGSDELVPLWRPYVEAAVEAFGPGRCMMASNYPPDGRSCGIVPLFNALKRITANYSSDEKAALFSGTASSVYSLSAV